MKKNILIALVALSSSLFASSTNLNSCFACHGYNFKKVAMGKSKVVANMSEDQIKTALDGYKDGTYGGSMKGVMKAQVKRISDTSATAKAIVALNSNMDSSGTDSVMVKSKKNDKEKCLSQLKNIQDCVLNSETPKAMQECRIKLVKFAEKVKTKHNVD